MEAHNEGISLFGAWNITDELLHLVFLFMNHPWVLALFSLPGKFSLGFWGEWSEDDDSHEASNKHVSSSTLPLRIPHVFRNSRVPQNHQLANEQIYRWWLNGMAVTCDHRIRSLATTNKKTGFGSLVTTKCGHLRPQNVTFADRANKTSAVHAVTCDHTSRSLATKNWDHLASLGSLVPMHGVGGVGGGVGW